MKGIEKRIHDALINQYKYINKKNLILILKILDIPFNEKIIMNKKYNIKRKIIEIINKINIEKHFIQHINYIDNLSYNNYQLLIDYTTNSKPYNNYIKYKCMRKPPIADRLIASKKDFNSINTIIKKSPRISNNIILYRGIFVSSSNKTIYSGKNYTPIKLKNLKINDDISFISYTSFSLDPKTAFDFTHGGTCCLFIYKVHSDLPKDNILVNSIKYSYDEYEVIIPPAVYKITNINIINNFKIIEIDLIKILNVNKLCD